MEYSTIKSRILEAVIIYLIIGTINAVTYFTELYQILPFRSEYIFWTGLLSPVFLSFTYLITAVLIERLPIQLRLVTFRTIFWTCILLLDLLLRLFNADGIAEYPNYLLFLNNSWLIPISTLTLNLNGHISSEALIYTNFILTTIILFGLIEWLIVKVGISTANKILTARNKR